MKINIPKILQPLEMGKYAKEMGGQAIQVWVNPPLAQRVAYESLRVRLTAVIEEIQKLRAVPAPEKPDQEKIKEKDTEGQELLHKLDGCLAELWSQGPEETRLSAEEIQNFREESARTDPKLFGWLIRSSWEMINAHQVDVKNA